MSDNESFDEDDSPHRSSLIRLLLKLTPKSDTEILRRSLSDYCYNVNDNDEVSNNLAGTDLDLSFGGGFIYGRNSFYSLLRSRQFKCGSFLHHSMQQYTSKLIPNMPGIMRSDMSRIFVSRYSKDGSIFYIATQDGIITLYSVPSFKPFRCIEACEVGWAVISCSLNSTNNLLVYSTWSPCLYLYHTNDPLSTPFSICLKPRQDRFAIFDTAFSHDSAVIATTCSDGYVYFCDVEHKKRTERVAAHEDHANACVFLDNSSTLMLSGGEDGLIRLWDTRGIRSERDHPVATFTGHIDSITSLDARFDERHFLSNSKDQTAKLWDVRRPGDTCAIERSKTVVSRQNWDYRWNDAPGFISQMRLRGDSSLCSYTGHRVLSTLIRAKFSPQHTTNSKYIYTGSHGHHSRAHIYDMLTGKLVDKVGRHSALIRDLDWHPYEMWLNTSSWDGTWVQWKYVHAE